MQCGTVHLRLPSEVEIMFCFLRQGKIYIRLAIFSGEEKICEMGSNMLHVVLTKCTEASKKSYRPMLNIKKALLYTI